MKYTSRSWFDGAIVELTQNDNVDNTPYFASPRPRMFMPVFSGKVKQICYGSGLIRSRLDPVGRSSWVDWTQPQSWQTSLLL